MKIYIVSCNWGQGGPGSIARDLYKTAIAQGHEVRFAYGRDSIPEDVNSFYFADRVDVVSHFLSASIFDNEGFCSKRSTKRLIDDITKYNPDIINIHNELGHTLNIPLLIRFIRKSGIRTFWTLHDAWLLTGHCITGLCDKFNKGCGHCPKKNEYPKSYVFECSSKNLEKKEKLLLPVIPNLSFITPSIWLHNLAKCSYIKDYNVSVIHNGIDLSVFRFCDNSLREKYNLENKIVLLTVANIWTKYKGVDFFYKTSKLLGEKYAFVIIGANIPHYIRNDRRIISIGRTKNVKELVDWYSTADIFVNPTMGDNFPTVNIEALACGLPVITFDTGGSGESIGECGKIVPQGNVKEMKNIIEQFQGVSKATCRERALNYDKEDRYLEYLNLFKTSLN